jgi:hypothetical protein
MLFDQPGSQSPHRSVARYAGADDAAANHQHVEPSLFELRDLRVRSRGMMIHRRHVRLSIKT